MFDWNKKTEEYQQGTCALLSTSPTISQHPHPNDAWNNYTFWIQEAIGIPASYT